MQLPVMLHGPQADVRKRCLQAVRQLIRGAPYVEVIGETADSGSLPGNLVIEASRGSLGDAPHTHCSRITFEIEKAIVAKRLPEHVEEAVVHASLGSAGGITTLLGGSGETMLIGGPHWLTFLRAVRAHWSELIAIGPRYSKGGPVPRELWQWPSTIATALAQLGVPLERLRGAFTREGLEPFAAELNL